jgi:large subunit ribosomal protein LP0
VLQTRVAELEKSNPFFDDLQKFGPAIKELDALRNLLTGKVGLVFSDVPVFELKPIIEANKVETQARVGAIAPIDVFIPPGPTGMDPSQISFFHALSISTKIEKVSAVTPSLQN